MPKVLLSGAGGSLAGALLRSVPPGYDVQAFERSELDITDERAVRAVFESVRPALVINGAAYNAVDRAQGEGAADALRVNALGPTVLALAARDFGARFVHFSTDFVFDGRKSSPYVETDATNPTSVYGASKLCGENVCAATEARNLAIRVCRLFGPTREDGSGSARKPGGNFPLLMLRLAQERGKVRVVADQIGSPTYTPDLARAVWQLIDKPDAGGVFHLCNAGEVSFADYAEEIFRLAGIECEVERVSSAQYGAPAQRPLYSTLDCSKAWRAGVTPLRDWREALAEAMNEFLTGSGESVS